MAKRKTTVEKLEADFLKIFTNIENGDLNVLDGVLAARSLKTELENVLKVATDKEASIMSAIQDEAAKYKNKYKGYSFSIGGKKTLVYKGIPEFEAADKVLSDVKDKYKIAFEGSQKGTTKIHLLDVGDYKNVPHFEDENGMFRPFPEITYSKTSLTLRKEK